MAKEPVVALMYGAGGPFRCRHRTHGPAGDMGANPLRRRVLCWPRRRDGSDRRGKRGKVIVIDGANADGGCADEWLRSFRAPMRRCCSRRPHLFDENLINPVRTSTASTRCDGSPRMPQSAGKRRHRHRRRSIVSWHVTSRHREMSGVRPNRVVQPGIREPGQLAGRRDQHLDRTFRQTRWRDVSATDSLVDHHAAVAGSGGWHPEFGRWRTRVRGAKEVLGQTPVSCMAEEIATPATASSRR